MGGEKKNGGERIEKLLKVIRGLASGGAQVEAEGHDAAAPGSHADAPVPGGRRYPRAA